MNIRPLIFTLVVMYPWCHHASAIDLSKCLRFTAPEQKSIISLPSCTLGVDSSCQSIYKTEIKVRYFPENADTAVVKTIGKIYRAPFKQIWDLSTIPNQLFVGIGVIIEVSFNSGDVSGLFREGIFLTHKPVTYPDPQRVVYEYPNTVELSGDSTVIPLSNNGSAVIHSWWNEKEVAFRILVKDTTFDTSASTSILEQSGVEILLDPTLKRKPYPSEDIMIYSFPLSQKPPYRITYKPVWNDSGGFSLNPGTLRATCNHSVSAWNGKGYQLNVSLPSYLFGASLPEKMSYNVIVKSADQSGKFVTTSLIGARGYNNYSPFLWSELAFAPKPVTKSRWIILVVSFLSGLVIPLAGYGMWLIAVKDRPVVLHINKPDEQNKVFQNIKETINQHITRTEISVADIATALQKQPKALERTIKKVTGMSFKNYVMYLRTEIVCERLRSSHSSEVSIAETCGFKNVNEMEKYFQRFHHTTPFNFRKTQQITQLQ